MTDIQSFGNKLLINLEKVIVGKRQVIETIIVGLLCQGHVLIEDVPGVARRYWRAVWRNHWVARSTVFSSRLICSPVM